MTATTTTEKCERCELPHGTCHHTATPLDVGDTISAGMVHGRWVLANNMRPNSRIKDAEGGAWVKTRRRDGCWESLTHGTVWPLDMIIDERQGYGPVTVEHVAKRRRVRGHQD